MNHFTYFNLLLIFFTIGLYPVGIFSHIALLMHQHVQKGMLVFFLFKRLKQGFLSLRHRTANTMAVALELANINAWRRNFAHLWSGLGVGMARGWAYLVRINLRPRVMRNV